MATRKMVMLTAYLEAAQIESLRALSKRTRIPIAVYQREGIDLVLEKHAPQDPPPLDLEIDE